jgi:hypothetical protein
MSAPADKSKIDILFAPNMQILANIYVTLIGTAFCLYISRQKYINAKLFCVFFLTEKEFLEVRVFIDCRSVVISIST